MKLLTSCLVWVRFGSFGRQLAHVDKLLLDGDLLAVHKWRDQSRRWTHSRILIPVDDVRSEDVDLVDRVVQRALKAATPGRPPCHHKHHFIPQVKTAAPCPDGVKVLAGVGGAQ